MRYHPVLAIWIAMIGSLFFLCARAEALIREEPADELHSLFLLDRGGDAADRSGAARRGIPTALRALLLTGQNNHNWTETTPFLADPDGQPVLHRRGERTPGTVSAGDAAGLRRGPEQLELRRAR